MNILPLLLLALTCISTGCYAGLVSDKVAVAWVKERQALLCEHFQVQDMQELMQARSIFPLRNYLRPSISRLVPRTNWAKDLGYGDEAYFNSAFHRSVDIGHYCFTTFGWSFTQLMAVLEYIVFETNFRRANSAYYDYGVRRDLYYFIKPGIYKTLSITGIFNPDTPASSFNHRPDFSELQRIEDKEKTIESYDRKMLSITLIGDKSYRHASRKAFNLLLTPPDTPSTSIANVKRIADIEKWKGDGGSIDIKWHTTTGHGPEASLIPLTDTFSIPESQGPKSRFDNHDSLTGDDGSPVYLAWLHTHPFYISSAMSHIETLFQNALKLTEQGEILEAIAHIHWWIVQTAPYYRGSGSIAEILINIIAKYHNFTFPEWRDGVSPSTEILTSPDENEFVESYSSLINAIPEPESVKAETETDKESDYKKALSSYMEEKKLIIQNTSGAGGNCFLHAIAAQTKESPDTVTARLKERIITLINNLQDGKPITDEDSPYPFTLAELFSSLEQLETGAWIDVTMAYVVIAEYQLPLHLTHPNHQAGNVLEHGYINEHRSQQNLGPELNLIFINGNHWAWALPANGTTFHDGARSSPLVIPAIGNSVFPPFPE